jgi:hypothetical protein
MGANNEFYWKACITLCVCVGGGGDFYWVNAHMHRKIKNLIEKLLNLEVGLEPTIQIFNFKVNIF